MNLLTIIIKGSGDVPPMVHANQILFNKLKRLIIKSFNSRTKTAYSLVKKMLRSEEVQDFFGLTVYNREPLDDQEMYFLDGLYYIIPNSKTLRKIVNGEVTQLLTQNTLNNMTEEEILDNLGEFFTDIRAYVRTEHNQDIS
ncbi:hypothetical protein LCGC14_0610830 [marine sediment metagenome]|uniref:Uncharacterized protein n=1 Tax=marine sediment metagenome TaxID=412755 RepID=A0A0F9UGA3_9ZZZZ|nr:hypothetical protein [bacterium]